MKQGKENARYALRKFAELGNMTEREREDREATSSLSLLRTL